MKVMNAEEFREWIKKRYGDKEQVEKSKSDVEILSEIRSEYNCFNEEEEEKYRALSNAIQALKGPVKYGKWIWKNLNEYNYAICSVCGAPFIEYIFEDFDYCPNCGVKMERNNE